MSKEEFGLDLFEAIKLQAAIRQAECKRDVYLKKGLVVMVKLVEVEIESLKKQLHDILNKNTIEAPDLQRLLAIT